jgi:hypothetical protein
MRNHYLTLIILLGWAFLGAGCANRLDSTVAPEYTNIKTPVTKIGVTGDGASIASKAFLEAGYNTVDCGTEGKPITELGKEYNVPFIASIDKPDSSEAVWDGFYSFSMRVSETTKGSVVWSANSHYGEHGVFINQIGTSRDAMHDMVESFKKNFPPAAISPSIASNTTAIEPSSNIPIPPAIEPSIDTLKLGSGAIYTGDIENGKANGRGIVVWPNGEKYTGEFQDSRPNGHGVYNWPDGDKYEGEVKDNQLNGTGTLTHADGTKLSGLWKNGAYVGPVNGA